MLRRLFVLALLAVVSVVLFTDHASALVGRWAPAALTSVSNTDNSTCAIADAKVFCWGNNQYGQLGIGTADLLDHTLPVKVTDTGVLASKTVTKVTSGGDGYTCVIASNWPYCWGRNNSGELGNATLVDSYSPVAVVDTNGVLTGKTITDIAAGTAHTCVVANAKPYCWGAGGNGRLGRGSNTQSSIPVAVTASGVLNGVTVTSIAAGLAHTCVVGTTGGVGRTYCWGFNTSGQLGDNTTTAKNVPVAVSTTLGDLLLKDVLSVGAGNISATSCVVTKATDSKVYCWGAGGSGQLGVGSNANSSVPLAVSTSGVLSGKAISAAFVGGNRSCALDTAGMSYCWGSAYAGNSTAIQQTSPVAVTTTGVLNGTTLQSLGNGSSTCGIGVNARLYCWGSNTLGQLGDNTTTTRNEPVSVLAQGDVTNSSYRFYAPAGSSTPGAPLASTNTPAQLNYAGQAFRLRMGISPVTTSVTPIDIKASDASLKLQVAEKSAATCSVQSTGFVDVSTTTKVGWHTTSGVANGAVISTHANDPIISGTPIAQTYRSAVGNFTNSVAIDRGQAGLWDFSLADKGMTYGGSYCLRIVYSNDTTLEGTPVSYAEIMSTSDGFSMNLVNANGVATTPVFTMLAYPWASTCSNSLGNLTSANVKLRVYNATAANGWTVSMAATNGPGSVWQTSDGTKKYDYNDSSGSPVGCNSGSDGDGLAGALQIYTDLAGITTRTGCSTTGVSKGVTANFIQGSQDSLTLMSGAAGAQLGCYWDLGTTIFQQYIPAYQPPGEYSIDMTISAVAS